VLRIDLDEAQYDFYPVKSKWLMSRDKAGLKGLGIGDEAFMIGRFVNHEGKQRNRPTARFGAVAMMPDPADGIKNEHMGNHEQEAYLVETYTTCGYSGSPVFFYIPPFSSRPKADQAAAGFAKAGRIPVVPRGPWLLGVEWAHLVNNLDVLDKNGAKTGMHVLATTGMSCVAPSWKLLELLSDPGLVAERNKLDEE
jgi:hypothetical protein